MAKVGSSCEGSTRLKKVRLGSAPETTASAAISSPSERTTPVTAPSLMRMCWTSVSVRISVPAAFADSASARVKEPRPPRGNAAEPTGCASAAARRSRTAVEPADQGPSAVPKMPRAAMTARSNSVSKNSATKSATAMGPQRRRSKMPALPRLRTFRPVFRRFQRSSGVGLSIAGGVMDASCAKKPAVSSSDAANCAYFAASLSEKLAIPAAVLAASLQKKSALPSGVGAKTRGSGERTSYENLSSWRSRATAACSGPRVCASVEAWKPG